MKIMKAVLVLTVAWTCAFTASSARAEVDEQQCEEIFRACDLNNDGVISKDEWDALDKNKDDTVSHDEWAKYHYSTPESQSKPMRLQFYDKNKDAAMDKSEFMEMIRRP
jgi:hypothetical protein